MTLSYNSEKYIQILDPSTIVDIIMQMKEKLEVIKFICINMYQGSRKKVISRLLLNATIVSNKNSRS